MIQSVKALLTTAILFFSAHGYADGDKILLVDDDKLQLGIVASVVSLEFPQLNVLQAFDRSQGIDIFTRESADIIMVISDKSMTETGTGLDLLADIRKLNATVPFILGSAEVPTDRIELARLQALSVTGFLTKPYDIEKFIATITAVLKSKDCPHILPLVVQSPATVDSALKISKAE